MSNPDHGEKPLSSNADPDSLPPPEAEDDCKRVLEKDLDRLIPQKIRASIPQLYGCHEDPDPIAQAKLFTPWAGWSWYVLEFDGKDICFGWVVGLEMELGYFSLAEIAALRGPGGILVERDLYFRPAPLRCVQEAHGADLDRVWPGQVEETRGSYSEPILIRVSPDRIPSPFEQPKIRLAETWLTAIRPDCKQTRVEAPIVAAVIMRELIGFSDREHFISLFLNAASQVTHAHVVSRGTLTSTLVHPREVFKGAVLANAASIIVGHNHPSGSVVPSDDDRATEERLKRAGTLLGIPVVDSFVVGPDESFYSSTLGKVVEPG